MDRNENYSLLLLAGGKSSRMGKNKAQLLYEGQTFTEVLIAKAKKLGIEQIFVSGFACDRDDVKVVWDIYPERGPLGGVHAGMEAMKTPFCLVVPVDVPQIPVSVLEELLMFHMKQMCLEGFGNLLDHESKKSEGLDGTGQFIEERKMIPVLLEHGDRRENLIGIYPTQMVDFIEDLIREHSASVHGMLRAWGFCCCKIDIPEWQVENINTQEAYKNLLAVTKVNE